MENLSNQDNDAVDFLRSILKTPSLSGQEQEVAKLLKAQLYSHGFRILESSIGNVVGVKGQGHPILLVASHMDTVPTNNPYREENNRIYATGAVDCKPSLAAMVYGFSTLDSIEGTLILAGIVHEEDAIFGLQEVFRLLSQEQLVPQYAIFGEPTEVNRICLGYRGRIAVKVSGKAEPAHSSSPWDSDNIIELMWDYYQKIKEFTEHENQSYKEQHSNSPEENHFKEITASITIIHGGEISNTLPSAANAEIDIRIPTWIEHDDLANTLLGLVEKISINQKTTQFSVQLLSNFNACEVPPTHLLVNTLRWAAFKELKQKIVMLNKTGSTFTNLIQEQFHAQDPEFACITYGPGNPRLEHTDGEYIELEDYLKTIAIYKRFYPRLIKIYSELKK